MTPVLESNGPGRPVDRLRNAGPEAESYYHLSDCDLTRHPCSGTACFLARNTHGQPHPSHATDTPRVYCLGQCFAAPAERPARIKPDVHLHTRENILLRGIATRSGPTLPAYQQRGSALEKALARTPGEIVREVQASQLRGRGGAGFPTGIKWAAAAAAPSPQKYIVANADEGDSGAFIDRFLMEEDPHALIEGMTIAAHAIGATEGWIYLRREYPFAQRALESALAESRAAGRLGPNILGSPLNFEIHIAIGHGSYVCGEETALLASLEGRRPQVMARPPYATEHGLHGRPTLINNVETFANIPWIIEHGGNAYQAIGFSRSRGTKVLSLNSLFQRPGLHEVEFGVSVRQIVEEYGGGLRSGPLKGVIIGGPLAGIIPPDLLDTPFGFEELHAIGASVGHGGVLGFDASTSLCALLEHLFAFGAYESCGKCTPCRLGTQRLAEIFAGGRVSSSASEVPALVEALLKTSLCGHGTGLAEFAKSAMTHYREEFAACRK